MNRREFMAMGASGLALASWTGLKLASGSFDGGLVLHGMRSGHDAAKESLAGMAPSKTVRTETLIVGGGVGGVSCSYFLSKKQRRHDHIIIEAEAEIGGNSSFGGGNGTLFPWGAHYLPIPSAESWHVREILSDLGFLRKNANGGTEYDERHLVHAPEERMFHDGRWVGGLWPDEILSAAEKRENLKFLEMIREYSTVKGSDGKRAFAIPMTASSADPKFTALDAETFDGWLRKEGFSSKAFFERMNHCCLDDYGADASSVSAWAGIHYFASRRPSGESGKFLTWPEGLGRLITGMRGLSNGSVIRGAAFNVEELPGGLISTYAISGDEIVRVVSDNLVWAAPLRSAKFAMAGISGLLPVSPPPSSPWMVSNIWLNDWPKLDKGNHPMAWDNVIRGSGSLGYVLATHQSVSQSTHGPTVMTHYRPLSNATKGFPEARKALLTAKWPDVVSGILDELSAPHPEIRAITTRVDCRALGHAMACPVPGFLGAAGMGINRRHPRISFAHSDVSGYSIFEEAAWHGAAVADKVDGLNGRQKGRMQKV